MGLVVNTNLSSLNAQRNLDATGIQMNKAMQRLSSGMRINSAADDAAGLAIATRLGSQVRGVNQAQRNANDGIAMLQTAEGALSEVTNIVTRIKELAVQSANGSNSTTDRSSIDNEVQQLISEVTRIATQSKFGSTALLDGTFTGTFQVGTNTGETISQSISNFRASALTGSVATQSDTVQGDVTILGAANANKYGGVNSATALLINGPKGVAYVRQTVAGDDTSSAAGNATSAIATVKAVNEATSVTGVVATATAATFSTGSGGIGFTNDINIDGSTNKVTVNGQSVVVNLNGGSTAADQALFIAAVNSQVSGVTAAANGTHGITLTASDGRNISVSATGSTANTAGGEVFGFTTTVASETVVGRGGIQFQAGGAITTTFTGAGTVTGQGATAATSTALSSLSVSTVAGANTAMFLADAILDTISTARGTLGAVQNRLSSTVANLGVVAEKVTDAKSRILDADFAQETANLTKGEILQQAGISVLSQANSRPQEVLKLLQ